jgi:ADP-heptose:LPS heptosyltransferase
LDVLLVRAGALGDLLLLRRTIAGLRGAGHRVRLVAPAAPASALLGPGAGEVAEVLPWDGPEMATVLSGEERASPVAEALKAADVVLVFTRSGSVVSALGARARRLVVHDPAPPDGGPHASAWLARALLSLAIDAPPDPPPLEFTEAEEAQAKALAEQMPPAFLAVHPGSGSPLKNWPLERFAEAARRVSREARWLLVLGPAEEGVRPLPGSVVARGWAPRRLAAALSRAGLFLGNDSGASHLAAAAGARTLALFGPTDPARWAPVGPEVTTLRAPSGVMTDLRVEEVVAAACRLKRAARPAPAG